MNLSELSVADLRRAVGLKEQIESLKTELASLVGDGDGNGPTPRIRRMSASARNKIAAAQRARWAKVKGQKPETTGAAGGEAPKKRKMSAAGRAKIAAAAKARWAKFRASK